MTLDSSTTIVDDQQVRSQVDVGISEQVANTYGLGARTVCAPFTSAMPGGSTAAPYFDGSYLHCRITSVSTLAQVQASPNSAMSLTHADGVYHWSFAPSQASLGGIALPGLNTGIDSVHVSVTFPGRVTQVSGDGHVRGRTVTWNVPGDINASLSATGSDHPGSGLSWWRWLLVIPQALMVLVAAVMVIRLERQRRRTATAPASTVAGTGPAPAAGPAPTASTVPPTVPSSPEQGPGAHAWQPPGVASTSPSSLTGPAVPSPGTQAQPDVPLDAPPQQPAPPPRPADPWGGRSPWQRPE